MKLITLNTWAGKLKQPFEAFLEAHKDTTDIFCFQEVFNDYSSEHEEDLVNHTDGNKHLLQEIANILTDFEVHFCPVAEETYGIAIFLKKGIEIIQSGEVLLLDATTEDHTRKMQWIHIKQGTKDVIVMNIHGHWSAAGKDDNTHRLTQSKIINEFLESAGMVPKILVGDLNLNLNTESIKLIETYTINLVKEKGIATTRTELYTGTDPHADYVFISPEVFLNEFKVLPDVVSDHFPLYLDFDLF
jgi:endonuclease/exonuclease/phosphatase family metal-dependent hydrolase